MHIKKFPLFFISVLFHHFAVGQCSYNLPDTVCPLQTITISNPGNLSVDQCSHRLDSLMNIQNLPPLIDLGTYQFKIIKEDDRYFILTNTYGYPNMRRYEFNSKFDALLNTANLITPNDNIINSIGFDMVKIDTLKWVAFKADFNNNNLCRIEYDSLTDDSLSFQLLGNFGINNPVRLKIFGNYLFVSNLGDQTVCKIHFDSTFQNVLDFAVISGPFHAPRQVDIIYDCNAGNYYGYVANYDNSSITRLDFGNSLSNNTPAVSSLAASVGPILGLKMYYQQNEWYCFTANSSLGFKLFKLGDPENLNPVLLLDTSYSGLTFPTSIDLLNDSSQLNVISAFNMTHFTFAPNCNSNTSWAQGLDSVSFICPLDTGWQYVEIATEDTDHVTYYINDSIYVFIPPPVASFTNSGACEGQPISFTDASYICYGNVVNWQWSFGDGNTSTLQNPLHTYATGGTFNVTLTVYASNNDSSTYSNDITLLPIPVAQYTPSSFSECSNYPIHFSDSSTTANGSIVSWLWYFGTLDSSNIQNPDYTFTSAGNYNVQLIATSSIGCVDTVDHPITISPTPLAQFTLAGTCAGGAVTFTNLTDSATNAVVNYNWYFGNNDSSQAADTIYSYAAVDSTYYVQLIATAANGCSTTFTSDVTIAHPALVSFTVSEDTVCKNVPILFINTSTTQNINDSIVYRRWEFSDGFIAENVDTVTHAFSQSGNGWVILNVVTATYCDSIYGQSLFVLDNPVADFTYTNVCFNDSNFFVSTSVPATGDNLVSYSWNFGDLTSMVNTTPAYHAYSDTGLYNAQLTIVSSKGCSDSITKAVAVYELPIANFITPNVLCNDSATQFTDNTYININDTLNSWNWNFGNSSTSVSQNPTNNYAQPGTYNVQLVVTTKKGCSDTIVQPITVKLSPSPTFTYDSICHGYNTHFYFSDSSPVTDPVNAWNWNFGESGSGNNTLENPVHQYLFPGTYNVTVTATNVNQCFKSYSQPVIIHSNPVVGFTTANPCEKAVALFTDTSTVSGDSITQWNWIINAASVSTSSTASYTFSTPGSYIVQLTATSNAGCSSTSTNAVSIYANPVASFTQSPSYAIPNQVVNFTNTSQNAVSYSWNFGDGLSSSLTSPSHAFADTNVYNITLIATSDKGCTDTARVLYNVLIPDLEVAVTDVNSQLQSNLLTLSAKLINLGNVSIDNYRVVANVEGLPSLVELSTLPLTVALPTVVYTLKTKIEVTDDFDPGYYCIEVQKPNGVDDRNLLNNRLCKSIAGSFGLLNIVPNPAVGDIQLYINSPFAQGVTIEIYDNTSRLVLSEVSNLKKGFNNVIFETSHLDKGIYFLRLYNGSVQIKSTFVKQ